MSDTTLVATTSRKRQPKLFSVLAVAQHPAMRTATLCLATLLWGIGVVHMTFIARLLYVPLKRYAVAVMMSALAGAMVALVLSGLERWRSGKKWTAATETAGAAAFAVFIAFTVGLGGTEKALEQSQKLFKTERDAFAQAPDGFALIQQLAHSHFGLLVELGDVQESWLVTTHTGPGSSVAQIGIGPGYCVLSVSPRDVAGAFPLKAAAKVSGGDRLTMRTVLIHELGHCVDIARDVGSFQRQSVGTHSVAPEDQSV